MLEIYYGNAKNKSRLCAGASALAALKQKNVLYVRFFSLGESDGSTLSDLIPGITVLCPQAPVSPDELSEEKRSFASREMREFFDRAVRLALTFKYEVLLMEGLFDAVNAGLLPESEVYGFLSDAPDKVEIICTGKEPDGRFLALADEAVLLTETTPAD